MTQATSAPVQGSPAPAQTTLRTVCGIENVGNVAALYQAQSAQMRVMENRLEALYDRRRSFAIRAREGNAAEGADKAGVDAQISLLDEQILDLSTEIAAHSTRLACVAGIPGATRSAPQSNPNSNDELAIAGLFLSTILALPLVIAWSRRLWRRSVQSVPYMPAELNERLMRIEQSVESVAIEVERVGEGQRFVTNLFAQNGRAIGAGAMEPVDVQQRERVAQERRDR